MPTNPAERQRRYRERLRSGQLRASTFVPLDLVEKLVEAGLLSEPTASDKKSLGAALVAATRRWSKGVTR